VNVSLVVPSSEMEAVVNRTMFTAATSATETRNGIEPSSNFALSVRSLKIDISPTLGSRLSGNISLVQASVTGIDFSLTPRAMTLNSLVEEAGGLRAAQDGVWDVGMVGSHDAPQCPRACLSADLSQPGRRHLANV